MSITADSLIAAYEANPSGSVYVQSVESVEVDPLEEDPTFQDNIRAAFKGVKHRNPIRCKWRITKRKDGSPVRGRLVFYFQDGKRLTAQL